MKTRRLVSWAAAAALLAGMTACSGADEAPSPSASGTESTSAEPVAIPDSDLGAVSQWMLDVFNGEEEITAEVVEERFAPEFIELVGGAEAVATSFAGAVPLGPFTLVAYQEDGASAGTRLRADDQEYVLSVTLDDDGLISASALQPAPEIPELATSWDEVTERAENLGAPVEVTVFDVSSGAVGQPQFEAGTLEGAQPSGSMFKLFVLLAVVRAVEDDELTWEQPLTVEESVRSLPSGVLQNEPDGTEVSVQDAATGMISISDNTATDMLIDAVGADAVEAVMAEIATDSAGENDPLLTTRGLFEIGWGEGDLAQQWADGDDTVRESLLDDVAAGPLTTTATDVTTPVWDQGLDWFFTPADLARAHVALAEAADTEAGAPVSAIMTENPGLDLGGAWDSVAFKGGSSIGVLVGRGC